jgi:general secretion pathway protein H
LDPTGIKVELETQPRSQAGIVRASSSAGFTLIEVVCVLAIIAILAAIALPAIPRSTSRQQLEAYATETAALLDTDQENARRNHRDVATAVDALSRTIRSGATGLVVRLPSDVTVHAIFAARCQGRAAGTAIHHLASGMSCGGAIELRRPGDGFQIKVNWLTGGAEVVPIH